MENNLYGKNQFPIYSNLNECKKVFRVIEKFLKDELTKFDLHETLTSTNIRFGAVKYNKNFN